MLLPISNKDKIRKIIVLVFVNKEYNLYKSVSLKRGMLINENCFGGVVGDHERVGVEGNINIFHWNDEQPQFFTHVAFVEHSKSNIFLCINM